MDKATLVPKFGTPGKDSFKCEFTKVTDDGTPVRYDVLWNVDGVWTYEDTLDDDVIEESLDSKLANALKDGSTVSVEYV